MRYLGYTLADPATTFPPPTEEQFAAMDALMEDAALAGVLKAAGGFGPVEDATRVRYADGEFTVLDGPFTEAKELIGGWGLIECETKAEAIEWTKRFLAVGGSGETTIRPVF